MFDIRKLQERAILEAVKSKAGEETAKAIVYGEDGTAAGQDNADWVNSTMRRMEEAFDAKDTKLIRMQCQCGYGMDEKVDLVKRLIASSSCMEELADLPEARAAGLSCQDGSLHLQFGFCPCPMLAKVEKLDSLTWCQCSAGYSKTLFESALGCEVEVDLLKSIKHGDDICLMKIVPMT